MISLEFGTIFEWERFEWRKNSEIFLQNIAHKEFVFFI